MAGLPGTLLKPTVLARLAILLALVVATHATEPRKNSTANPKAANPKVINEAGFTVIGIEARTSNAREMTPDAVIAKQWARVMKENLVAQIPNKSDSAIIALYADYASDKDGDYTILIGARVASAAEVPAGMVARKVPAGSYAIFTSEKGPVAKIVFKTWQDIWAIPKSSPGGDRTYKSDYEVYDDRAADPQDAQIDVHIGINGVMSHK